MPAETSDWERLKEIAKQDDDSGVLARCLLTVQEAQEADRRKAREMELSRRTVTGR
jgi:hypothetical protein